MRTTAASACQWRACCVQGRDRVRLPARRSVPQRPSTPALGLGEFQRLIYAPCAGLPSSPSGPTAIAEPSPSRRRYLVTSAATTAAAVTALHPAVLHTTALCRPPPLSRLPSRPRSPPPSLCLASDDGDGVVGSGESPVVAAISSHSGRWQWQRPALSKVRRCVGDGGDQHMGSVNFNH